MGYLNKEDITKHKQRGVKRVIQSNNEITPSTNLEHFVVKIRYCKRLNAYQSKDRTVQFFLKNFKKISKKQHLKNIKALGVS